jgi:indole-3-acetate monooxygenase
VNAHVERPVADTPLDPVGRILAGVKALAPQIVAQRDAMEAACRLPPDLVEQLRALGVFRMFAPRRCGGLDLGLPDVARVVGAISRIDGSVGWDAMTGSSAVLFAPLLPPHLFEQVYRDGPDCVFAGSAQPAGKAEKVEGGWRVNGRWPFASGCQHADWLLGFCVMSENGKPLPGATEGTPLVRACILPAENWRIEDTWQVVGLRGTGSHHIALDDVFVQDEHFVDLFGGTPCVTGGLYSAISQVIPLMHGAVSIGIAEGSLDDLVALDNTGRQQQRATVPMRESEIFRAELGRIEADLRAAQAVWSEDIDLCWRHALGGTLKDDALLTRFGQTAAWVSKICLTVVQDCFALAGSSAIYETSPLQRRLRDIQVAAQHAIVHPRQYIKAGALLLDAAEAEAAA